ncbi:MAG: ammonium transporter, partial [Cyclobacteriaceae bacterium]|nr:ammonium transporter [Cyclobacteriaceae bacterium]
AAALVDGSWTMMQQLGVQVAAVLIAIAYAAVLTYILLIIVSKTVGLRSSNASEMAGLDNSYHGEHGYGMLNPN